MLRTLRGYVELEITGASPERCLNRLAEKDIPFWNLQQVDAFHLTCCLYAAHLEAARKEISSALCTEKVLRIRGLPHGVRGLRNRPVLIVGFLLALVLAYVSQCFVWFVRVEGAVEIPPEQILQAIDAEGVAFGAWGPKLDSQYLKNRMLNLIPQLRWLAVNREGGIAHVLVSEREKRLPEREPYQVTNVVASADGVVTGLSVLSGFPCVEIGDAVLEGQVLVTGIQEWTTHVQATTASAEVEAMTLHNLTLLMPDQTYEKAYTGREAVCRTLILKRNRIKISGNSSIFGTKCDKMIETKPLTLPGGYVLPVFLEIVTLREYALTPVEVTEQEASAIFQTVAEGTVGREMIAGTVASKRMIIDRTEGLFRCEAALNCREVISRTVEVPLFGEDVEYGQNHQRGTD